MLIFGEKDTEEIYKRRLSLETDVETDSVFHDMDTNVLKEAKKELRKLKRNSTEEEYLQWKEQYLTAEYEKVKGKKFLTCTYLFAGIGEYEATFPEEDKAAVECWINGNGSAFYGGDREATEEEIRRYIALHAADDEN